MPFRVKIENYQSIERADLSVEGFTVITGPNNTGKSSVLRAVSGLFENQRGHSFVRHGETNATVEVEFEDGPTVVWEKGKTANRYTLDGKVFDKVGSGVPEEVQEVGIRPIKVSDKTIWPQVAKQFSGQVFLLDLPGSVVAEAVADVERVGRLNGALRMSESDRKKTVATLKIRNGDLKEAKEDLEGFDGLAELSQEIDKVKSQCARLEKSKNALSILEELKGKIESSARDKKALEGVRVLRSPENPLRRLAEMEAELDATNALRGRIQQTLGEVNKCSGLDGFSAPEIKSQTLLDKTLRGMQVLRDLKANKRASEALLESLNGISSVIVPMSPSERLEGKSEALKSVKSMRESLRNSGSYFESAKQAADAKAKEVESLREELKDELSSHKNCPTCGQEVTSD